MKVCVGGTFDILHEGHKALLRKAFEVGDKVFIGLTSDRMVSKKDLRFSYAVRKKNIEEYLSEQKFSDYEILRIDTPPGLTLSRNFDAIVVSPETEKTARAINSARKRLRKRELKIIMVNYALAEDLIPFSSTRIRDGKISPSGKRLKPIIINVGSTNPVKIKAVTNVCGRLFKNPRVKGLNVKSEKQPYEDATIRGALKRAKQAIRSSDFGVGIEAGLFWSRKLRKYFDVQYCAIVDSTGFITLGHGPGFSYPDQIAELLENGYSVSEAVKELYGIKNIGKGKGAVGLLSKDLIDRTRLTEQAVIMALIPRISQRLS